MIGRILRGVFEAAATFREAGEEVLRVVTDGQRPEPPPRHADAPPPSRPSADLVEAFAEILERSRDPRGEPGDHPAHRAILAQLAPDEARIVELFSRVPEHPSIRVRAIPKYAFGTRTVIEAFTLIAEEAGAHHPELVPAYLDNLRRLGLVRITTERMPQADAYELLEVHPEVKRVKKRIRDAGERVKIERGTVRLSDLGRSFCAACLPSAGSRRG